jgi:putative serine protease PepD
VLVAVDGQRVTNANELIVEIRKRVPGEEVTIAFRRDGDRQTTVVTLGSARSD